MHCLQRCDPGQVPSKVNPCSVESPQWILICIRHSLLIWIAYFALSCGLSLRSLHRAVSVDMAKDLAWLSPRDRSQLPLGRLKS